MSLASARVPLVIVTGIVSFGLGALAGVAALSGYGYHWDREPEKRATEPIFGGAGGANPTATTSSGMGGGAPGGLGGGRGPGPKAQLASLVTKLDQLTQKPLAVELSLEQKKKIREQLQGLADKSEISDEDAKKRLDALIELLKEHKDTLEAAGYRWPGQAAGGGGRRPPANPFQDEQNGKHLKSLDARLAKGAA